MIFNVNTSTFARQLQTSSTKDIVKDLVSLTEETFNSLGLSFRTRIFTPYATLYMFLSQVFNDDSSCRRAVLEFASIRLAKKQNPCSTTTGSFCKARARLPLIVITKIVRYLADRLSGEKEMAWRHGRVLVVDGTGFSMPDTPNNAAKFVRHGASCHKKSTRNKSQPPIVGFPLGRVLGVFSLTTGAVIDLSISTWKGKGTGEQSLLQKLWPCFKKNDTLLGDANFSSFYIIASALSHGCHVVSELKKISYYQIKTNLRDQIIKIEKPKYISKSSISKNEHDRLPDHINVRIVKIICAPTGFRPKVKFIITTHVDYKLVTVEELAGLYHDRWQVELNFRSIKTVLGMDILRGKKPEMVVKEVWVHMLAYNLIRQKMVDTATEKKIPVTMISFRATQQAMAINRTLIACGIEIPNEKLVMALVTELVGKRPGRYEPRAVKRRPKNFKRLTDSRKNAKTKLHKKSKK